MKRLGFILAALLLASRGWATPIFQKSAAFSATSGSGLSGSYTTTTNTSEILIFHVVIGGADQLYPGAISWNGVSLKNSMFSFIAPLPAGYQGSYIYYLLNPPASTAGTFSITLNGTIGSGGLSAEIAEYSNVDQVNPLQGVQVGVLFNAAKTISSGTSMVTYLTQSAAASLVLDFATNYLADPITNQSGFTVRQSSSASGLQAAGDIADRAYGTTGLKTVSWTSSSTIYGDQILAELVSNSGASTYTPTPTPACTATAYKIAVLGDSWEAGVPGLYNDMGPVPPSCSPSLGESFRAYTANSLLANNIKVTWVGQYIDALGNSHEAVYGSGVASSGNNCSNSSEYQIAKNNLPSDGTFNMILLMDTGVNDALTSLSATARQQAQYAAITMCATGRSTVPVLVFNSTNNAYANNDYLRSSYNAATAYNVTLAAANGFTNVHLADMTGYTLALGSDNVHPADYLSGGLQYYATLVTGFIETYVNGACPSSTPTPTFTASPTPTPTATITQTFTASPTPTFTATSTFTATPTPTSTATPTKTPTATSTATPTFTASPTPTATNTPSPTATNTPTPAPTATPSKNVRSALNLSVPWGGANSRNLTIPFR